MKWVRQQIEKLQPYVPGKQTAGITVKLNANENPYPPSKHVTDALKDIHPDSFRLYPDAVASKLRQTISEVFHVNRDNVVVGNGSDDVLTMIIRTFLNEGDTIAVVDPTYTLYETLAGIQGAAMEVHCLNSDYSLPDSFFHTECKVVFLPNPNAQTGTLFEQKRIEVLCERGENIIVIDEAYVDFAGVSVIPLIKKYENLIVLRTLSKSYSLAGLRVGFGISAPDNINSLIKVKDSYNVNALSQIAAVQALLDQEHLKLNVAKIINTRKWFSEELAKSRR